MKEWTIKDIEALTEYEVLSMDHETARINGHDIYFVDFEGYFGFSALVFRAGAHLYYANDYELHHKTMTREELKTWYIDTMHNKLFSDDMIGQPIKDYNEGQRKEDYLRNYYPLMCEDKISAFHIFHNEAEKELFRQEIKGMIYNPIGFFYTNDKWFSDRLIELYKTAQKSKEATKDSYDYWFNAFKYEMYNHEYAISWEPDTSTLSAFGLSYEVGAEYENGSYEKGLNFLFDALDFTDIQRKAYRDARTYVLNNSSY